MQKTLLVVIAAIGLPAMLMAAPYAAESLNPKHLVDLDQRIQACAEQINCCPDPEKKCTYREELCKLFIQRKDFEHAYMVASEIYRSTTNPERKAAHHFLMAEIYGMKMEASPSVGMMEQNRREALRLANEVVTQQYPAKWGVSKAAQQLVNRLNDPKEMAAVRAWVEKRQSGGADDSAVALAKAQSASIKSGTSMPAGGRMIGPAGRPGDASKVVVQPAKSAALGRLKATFSGKKKGDAETSIWETPPTTASAPEPQVQPMAAGDFKYSNVTSTRLLREPIIIDGQTVRKAERIAVEPDTLSRPWPGKGEGATNASTASAKR